jgi:hypothetical protein
LVTARVAVRARNLAEEEKDEEAESRRGYLVSGNSRAADGFGRNASPGRPEFCSADGPGLLSLSHDVSRIDADRACFQDDGVRDKQNDVEVSALSARNGYGIELVHAR